MFISELSVRVRVCIGHGYLCKLPGVENKQAGATSLLLGVIQYHQHPPSVLRVLQSFCDSRSGIAPCLRKGCTQVTQSRYAMVTRMELQRLTCAVEVDLGQDMKWKASCAIVALGLD
jgi:hypothetical protein